MGQIRKHGKFHQTDSKGAKRKKKDKEKQIKGHGEGTCDGLDLCHTASTCDTSSCSTKFEIITIISDYLQLCLYKIWN